MRVLLLAAVLLLVRSLTAGVAQGGGKVDLTGYLATEPNVGDFVSAACSDGLVSTLVVIGKEPWRDGWAEVVREESNFSPDSVTWRYIEPGRWAYFGRYASDGFVVEARRPRKESPLRLKRGRKRKARYRAAVFLDGLRIGKARVVERTKLLGFQSFDAGSRVWPDTVAVASRRKTKLVDHATGRVIKTKTKSVTWFQRDLGPVWSTTRYREWLDGRLVVRTPLIDCWLTDHHVGDLRSEPDASSPPPPATARPPEALYLTRRGPRAARDP